MLGLTLAGAKPSRSLCIGAVATDVGRGARPALLAIRSQRYDLVRAALGGSAVKVDVSPRIGWHGAGLEVGPVPNPGIAGSLRQRSKAFAAGYPKSQQVSCSSSAPVDTVEQTVTAGSSSLSYDSSTDTYTYVWKTDKSWSGTCRQFVARLADSSYRRARFKFK